MRPGVGALTLLALAFCVLASGRATAQEPDERASETGAATVVAPATESDAPAAEVPHAAPREPGAEDRTHAERGDEAETRVEDAEEAEDEPGAEGEHGIDAESMHAIRVLLGLVALLALAWLGANERVRKLEERLGISQLVTSGLPFFALGAVFHAPQVGVLDEGVLVSLTPLLVFGLGWIGFHTGFQFEVRAMDEVPRGTAALVLLVTGASFVAIAVLCAITLLAAGLFTDVRTLARDATLVALAGALSAPTLGRLAGASSERALALARTVSVLDDVVGVLALAILASWLHPAGSWNLPGVGWLFVTFGMATTLALVIYVVLRGTESAAESTSLLLGSVCLAAGMAGWFELPPLVVCFFAGLLLRNMPGGDKAGLGAAFARLERPIYLVFLVVAGALWDYGDPRGWVLLPVFLVARTLGRWAGIRGARALPDESRPDALDDETARALITPPMGTLAVAFVITAQTLYESAGIRAIVTAVLIGALVIEGAGRVVARASRRAPSDPAPKAPQGSAADRTLADPAAVIGSEATVPIETASTASPAGGSPEPQSEDEVSGAE